VTPVLSREPVVLASGSATRARLLRDAGVEILVDRPAVDEEAAKQAFRADGATPDEAAEALADLKARRIAPRHPGRLVLAADQMLECEGEWFDKPADRAAAEVQLARLAGRTHRLVSAAVVHLDGQRIWHRIEVARMTMRPLGAPFLAAYLDAAGDAVLGSVGAYHVEGLGAQLFARIEGDHFTIQGLPLLPLLGFLRQRGVLPE
jgi:septum formation protein